MKNKVTKNLFFGKFGHCAVFTTPYLEFYLFRLAIKNDDLQSLENLFTYGHLSNPQIRFRIKDVAPARRIFKLFQKINKDYRHKIVRVDSKSIRVYYEDPELLEPLMNSMPKIRFDLRYKEQYSPRDNQHLTEMIQAQEQSTFLVKKKFVSSHNDYRFKIMLRSLHKLYSDNSLLDLIKEYEFNDLVHVPPSFKNMLHATSTIKVPGNWYLRYSKTFIRARDEGTATLLTMALGKKYVHHIVEEIVEV